MDEKNHEMRKSADTARKRRKKKKLTIFFIMVASLILVIGVLSMTIFFNIESFEVEENEAYSANEIIKASGLSEGKNMFRIDKFAIEDKIEKTLPYIEEAKINRRLPDTLEISVKLAKPYAYVAGGGDYILLSDKGKVLADLSAAPACMELIGSGIVKNTPGKNAEFGSESLNDIYLRMCEGIEEAGAAQEITELDISKSYDITFEWNGCVYVHFGSSNKFARKFELFKFILEKEEYYEYGIVNISDSNLNQASFIEVDTKEEYLTRKGHIEAPQDETVSEYDESEPDETESAPAESKASKEEKKKTEEKEDEEPEKEVKTDKKTDEKSKSDESSGISE